MPTAAINRWIEKMALRSALSGADVAGLRALPFRVVECAPKEDFVGHGEMTIDTSVVVSGLVARTASLSSGERQIVSFYVAGDMPDLHSVVLSGAVAGLQALTRSVVLRIPHAALRRLSANSPSLTTAFWRECSADAAVFAEWVLNLGQRTALGRMAHLMCEMAVRIRRIEGDEEFRFEFPVTQPQLADATGLSTVHVNRTLQALKARGLMHIEGGFVVVDQWRALAGLAEFDSSYLHMAA